MKPLILASASATRARLLAAAGVTFEIAAAAIDEEALKVDWLRKGYAATDMARGLAEEKARSVGMGWPGRIVLGCDQVLALDGELISKCRTRIDALLLLRRLRAREHELVTAAVLARDGEMLWRHVDGSRLVMRDFSDTFLNEYVLRCAAATTHCVGCYELEGPGIQLFSRVDGDFFSILGLPLLPLLEELRGLALLKP
ncbi:MAG TPA: Maf family nucleotide pyrophosphatase [Rhizomicrobium sp.]|nr:Maf family nucleotide pyrophosphatase [Rhizomicrobium sp.]